jgi:hypothetical protein
VYVVPTYAALAAAAAAAAFPAAAHLGLETLKYLRPSICTGACLHDIWGCEPEAWEQIPMKRPLHLEVTKRLSLRTAAALRPLIFKRQMNTVTQEAKAKMSGILLSSRSSNAPAQELSRNFLGLAARTLALP